jgi:hypothetical protein
MEEIANHVFYGQRIAMQREMLKDEAYSAIQPLSVVRRLGWPTWGDIHAQTPFRDIINEFDLGSMPIPPNLQLIELAVEKGLGWLEYALYGLAVDYAGIDYDHLLGPIGGCSAWSCHLSGGGQTLTLCDRCIDASDLGNIMFGVGGSARGYDISLATGGAYLFNISDENLSRALSKADARGTPVGWLVAEMGAYRSKWTFCALLEGLNFLGYHDSVEETAQCEPCQYEAPLNWHSEPSSIYYVSDWKKEARATTLDWLPTWVEGLFR